MKNKLPPIVGYPEVEWAELAYQLAKEAGDLYLAKEIAMKLANFHADT